MYRGNRLVNYRWIASKRRCSWYSLRSGDNANAAELSSYLGRTFTYQNITNGFDTGSLVMLPKTSKVVLSVRDF